MNTHQPFSFGEMISTGWSIFKSKWRFIILAGVATMVINFLFQALQQGFQPYKFFALLAMLLIGLISIMIKIGWAKVLLGLVRHSTVTWNTFKSEPAVWLRFIKTYLWFIGYTFVCSVGSALPFAILATIGFFTDVYWLTVVGVVLGVTAFVLVYIYYSIRYQFISYAVLDFPELSSKNIFKKAGALTKGSLVRLFMFGVVLGLINIAGFICLFVGLVATIPTTKLAHARVYQVLKERHQG